MHRRPSLAANACRQAKTDVWSVGQPCCPLAVLVSLGIFEGWDATGLVDTAWPRVEGMRMVF